MINLANAKEGFEVISNGMDFEIKQNLMPQESKEMENSEDLLEMIEDEMEITN